MELNYQVVIDLVSNMMLIAFPIGLDDCSKGYWNFC